MGRVQAGRREELCKLKVADFKHELRGVAHLNVSDKGERRSTFLSMEWLARASPIHGMATVLLNTPARH